MPFLSTRKHCITAVGAHFLVGGGLLLPDVPPYVARGVFCVGKVIGHGLDGGRLFPIYHLSLSIYHCWRGMRGFFQGAPPSFTCAPAVVNTTSY